MKMQPQLTQKMICSPRAQDPPRDVFVPKEKGWHTWREVVQRNTTARPSPAEPKTGIWT